MPSPPTRSPTWSTATWWRIQLGTVERLYAGWGLPIAAEFRGALEAYLAARHTARAGGHDYSFADTGLDLATHRALVTPYQQRFGVPSEV